MADAAKDRCLPGTSTIPTVKSANFLRTSPTFSRCLAGSRSAILSTGLLQEKLHENRSDGNHGHSSRPTGLLRSAQWTSVHPRPRLHPDLGDRSSPALVPVATGCKMHGQQFQALGSAELDGNLRLRRHAGPRAPRHPQRRPPRPPAHRRAQGGGDARGHLAGVEEIVGADGGRGQKVCRVDGGRRGRWNRGRRAQASYFSPASMGTSSQFSIGTSGHS